MSRPGNFEKNVDAVTRLGEPAAAKGITVSQLALAWLLTRGEHIVPVPGTRSPKRIEENAGAADVTLTKADLAAIDQILPHGGFGARYAEEHVPTWIRRTPGPQWCVSRRWDGSRCVGWSHSTRESSPR